MASRSMIFPRKLLRCFFKLRLVEGEVDLHPGGFSVVVAVCGKGVRVGLWHDLAGSVFNEDALGPAILDRSGSVAVALLHEIARSGVRSNPRRAAAAGTLSPRPRSGGGCRFFIRCYSPKLMAAFDLETRHNVWPIRVRLVSRYFSLCGLEGKRSGSCSTISRP